MIKKNCNLPYVYELLHTTQNQINNIYLLFIKKFDRALGINGP